jgi:hypothetical protein
MTYLEPVYSYLPICASYMLYIMMSGAETSTATAEYMELLIRIILKVPGTILGPETIYPEYNFHGFPSFSIARY